MVINNYFVIYATQRDVQDKKGQYLHLRDVTRLEGC
jgi:hypothetical protein